MEIQSLRPHAKTQNQNLQDIMQFPLCLAPMVGMTHVVLRRLVREYLPLNAKTIWPTEMLNSRKLPIENLETTPETMRHRTEEGLVPQILGNEKKPIEQSILILKNWGAIGIDINMGCPVNKALKHNYGVALMGDPDYAAEVVRFAVGASDLPVSVKLRAGLDSDFAYLKNFVQGLQSAGASWITLHPRLAAQKRRGEADWQLIARLREVIEIPVIGNGDIEIVADVQEMIRTTGCEGVMAGRALAARPWMMWQLGEDLGYSAPAGFEGLRAPRTEIEEGAEYGKSLLRWLTLSQEHFQNWPLALRKFRFHIRMTSMWLDFGHSLMSLAHKDCELEEMRQRIGDFFAVDQIMRDRSDLRA